MKMSTNHCCVNHSTGAILFGACALCLACSFFDCCQRRFCRTTYRQSTHPATPSVNEYPRGYSHQGIGSGADNNNSSIGNNDYKSNVYGGSANAAGLPVYFPDDESPGKLIA